MTYHTNHQTGVLPSRWNRDRRGFSLVEALTVIVIIGLMTGIAIPRSRLTTYRASSGAQVVATTLSVHLVRRSGGSRPESC